MYANSVIRSVEYRTHHQVGVYILPGPPPPQDVETPSMIKVSSQALQSLYLRKVLKYSPVLMSFSSFSKTFLIIFSYQSILVNFSLPFGKWKWQKYRVVYCIKFLTNYNKGKGSNIIFPIILRLLGRISSEGKGEVDGNLGKEN